MADQNISKINFPTQNISSNPTIPSSQPSFSQSPPLPPKSLKIRKRVISLDNLPDLLTVTEVADLLRVSPLTVKRWGNRGKLPAIRINSRGDRRYKKEAVLWLLGMQENKQEV